MKGYFRQLLETLSGGKRKQDVLDPTKFKYVKRFKNLTLGNTHIVVVVKFGWREESDRIYPNNFVLTAYQKYIAR